MTAMSAVAPDALRPARRFLRTPKGLLLPVLLVLAAIAAPAVGVGRVLPPLLSATVTAALVDLIILRLERRAWIFPSGAILTGLLVAMVLSPESRWFVPIATSALAISSKYLFRTRLANVFNPAAFALAVSAVAFGSGQSWWGALPDLPLVALALLLVAGVALVQHINKLPLVLTFLGGYYLLFTLASFSGDPGRVAEVFRPPDLNAVLFFALFMLDDPPTAPTRYPDQAVFALIAAVLAFVVYLAIGGVYYLLAGALGANVWEAWRRWHMRRRFAPSVPASSSPGHRPPVEAGIIDWSPSARRSKPR